ncbi:gamma-glutamyltransferase [Paenalcaligenes niemegkensis]|nr:gamma-glutamyltransferase [Paenalcaligenes niemegkensis]MCQ9617680.1 gamma-glutamyltransferase [Paenalcaligenes niemegkensis]
MKELLAPAISYARDGFVVSARVAGAFQRKDSLLKQCENTINTYQINGRWPQAGEILRLPDLAYSLELIANQGVQVMYTGELGERIISALERHGGLLSMDDLEQHQSYIEATVLGHYRGYQIAVQQPPTMGTLLLQQLALMEASRVPVTGWDSADWIHLMIEAKKASFSDLSAYLSDPGHCEIKPEQLLDSAYIKQRASDLSLSQAASYVPGEIGALLSHTTYLTIADKEGNVVSWIQSVFNEFGSCWIAPGTGFVMNNRLSGFSNDLEHINCVAAAKRTAHTLLAPMVLKDNKPVLALGTPGDYGQTQTNLQVISYILDHGFDVQRAIDAPRWRSLEGMEVAIEGRFSASLIKELSQRGHAMQVMEDWTDLMGGLKR